MVIDKSKSIVLKILSDLELIFLWFQLWICIFLIFSFPVQFPGREKCMLYVCCFLILCKKYKLFFKPIWLKFAVKTLLYGNGIYDLWFKWVREKGNKDEKTHRFALSAKRGDTTSSWSETSKLSLVVLDKECPKK